ncbi:FHA domain-containing protein [Trinickia dinghuensis]|uniref:YscD cytoplasmic domain-containing protein n=1 Tax=Trinickia dinghuensis TaxID=2291023 RepID=A0A3D8JV62_9BURK|nr:FHA domain-containing protein [Trinickia dinghuensis]RDU96947.1 hypothetical protein DWV00_20005 [Trinickia dinghuensis]
MLELRILTGLHRGAALPLEEDTIRIGGGSENDIVLLDPGMPPAASVIYRSQEGAWQYRSYRSIQQSGDTLDATGAPNGTALVAGARWFAGPVLIGCEEEGAPWPAEPVPCDTSRRAQARKRPTSFAMKMSAALVIAIALTVLVAVLALPGRPSNPARSAAASASASAVSALDADGPPIRVVSAIVYPEQAVRRPPFGIRSASTGPYGFVVTDDEHVLIPGSRWHAFTLVRIEPRRAVFTGPHAAELTW